ncbi:universal stress protein UspA [Desulfoplanes formicivorans]|uniref:Universal stress protein UspA n=1 Tax=Desulfoplanes formicivorans TaxID=1592317 RepID=A0A194AKH0_9BACT|nr:universal stress protein UspA [Desulfoplanes formicivorans]GAU09209.1 universal stress protein UspA [Desulfoplanes formicivorans]
MAPRLLHIFRNTPMGRETFLQSLYFCRQMHLDIDIYIPRQKQFLMYFDHEAVQINLDDSYLFAPETAREHAESLVRPKEIGYRFLQPEEQTASTLPDIPSDYAFMCLPRSVSDRTSKIGLGHLGPKVRAILRAAHFPVLIPSAVLKKWNKVTVFFGGSANALNALRVGMAVNQVTGAPLTIYIQSEGRPLDAYRSIIEDARLLESLNHCQARWAFFSDTAFENNLYTVPHDALVIAGAYGHGMIKTVMFGSKMELLQSTLPNNLLIVGPGYTR